MYYIGLDVHKRTISYCVKDAAGHVHSEGKIGSMRRELDAWIRTLPQPRMIAMEATIFTGWIYDHLLPHAEKVKVAHPLMLRAIAAAKKKNDRIDAGKIADCLRCDFLPECHMATREIRDRRRTLRYLMVIAQGYQESMLNQAAKNGGAVGIMQVKPSTAAAPPISIPNVMTAENNIHAGVKVLKTIADQYFSDPKIDPVNRLLFTFAAYNTGPNRIADLRRRAPAQGLDPNIWFGNMELMVGKSVGPTTVQYVSNIYKYYVAYKLVVEQGESLQ